MGQATQSTRTPTRAMVPMRDPKSEIYEMSTLLSSSQMFERKDFDLLPLFIN